MAEIKGGDKLAARLAEIAQGLKSGGTLQVGFLENATYPDGTSVALVAAANEFGKMVHSKNGDYFQLPRSFFRTMVADKGPEWPDAMALNLKATNYDVVKTLNLMGFGIKGQLQQSIRDTNSPPLAESTIRRKGFDKPLIDTSHMINSVDFVVDET